MLSPIVVILFALAWVGVLFAVALYGERHAPKLERHAGVAYVLSLGVYCTAWTFYGTVTQAARWGAWLPPTFVGTILLFVFGLPFLSKLAQVARAENAATLADLIASRFGKDPRLALTATAIAVVGMVPYVALQLKAVAMSYEMVTGGTLASPAWQDAAFWIAITMAVFVMLFGTRRAAATEHNRGLVFAVAFESLFKLVAMLAIGVFVVFFMHDGYGELAEAAKALPPARPDGAYLALIGLGALAMFTLPHQFHIGTVELRDPAHLRRSRFWFPVYLVLIALPVLPTAWAGLLALEGQVPTDLLVLGLPLSQGNHALALFAFLGGMSAATGMVVITALTLSLMIANHWLAPWLVRDAALSDAHRDLRPTVLILRRIAIAVVMTLAFAYSRAMGLSDALADIGALSFSALAQLAPAVVLAVYVPKLPARAVLAGMLVGFAAWLWLLLAPVASGAGLISFAAWPSALSWLTPDNFFGLAALDPLARGVLVSLALNVGVIALLAQRGTRKAIEPLGDLTVGSLRGLAARFLSPAQLAPLMQAGRDGDRPAPQVVERLERELAGVIGAASARLLLDAARGKLDHLMGDAPLDTVATLVGEASQALRFNQRLLEAALENMSQGISVVDADLKLVAWNRRYAELFGYPPDLLAVGTPVESLVRYSVSQLLPADADAEREVAKRLAHMRRGTPYVTERSFPARATDATTGTGAAHIIEIRGNPMPGGGFVATFTDVTAFRRAEHELRRNAETLEQRVAERTEESEQARAEAERANQAKSRFLVAVSHDLLQPINAAHLFTHALAQQLTQQPSAAQYRTNVEHIDGALGSAETLLASLLDISRLDAGGMVPQVRDFALDDWLSHLASEFSVLAREKGLTLDFIPCRAHVRSDPQLLRRVLQNFLSNAIRYTARGRIVLGARRRGDAIELQVYDTGPGIAASDRAVIFEEFRRLDRGGQGLGLGLSIAERIARLLGHEITLESRVGRGTMFGIRVPRGVAQPIAAAPAPAAEIATPRQRVLVVDNDAGVLKGMETLLAGWRCEVSGARSLEEAERMAAAKGADVLLLDYHLDGATTGIDLYRRLAARDGAKPCVIITADHSETTRAEVAAAGCHLLHKPLRPLALRSLLARFATQAAVESPAVEDASAP